MHSFSLFSLWIFLHRMTDVVFAQTVWGGGVYKIMLEFTEEYPSRPPKCMCAFLRLAGWIMVRC